MRGRYRHVPLAQWLAGGFVLAALASVAIPAWGEVANRDAQRKALAQARQIGLALKIFAADYNGVYPKDGVPNSLHAPANSNAAFAALVPLYTQSEELFSNALSVYQTHPSDNVIDIPYTGKPVKTLEPGENVYAYVMGLEESFNAAYPLVADGTDGTGHYVTDPTKHGGVWGGAEAIVIRLDLSSAIEELAGPANARYVPLDPKLPNAYDAKPDDNLLDVPRWKKGLRLLDPAIDKTQIVIEKSN